MIQGYELPLSNRSHIHVQAILQESIACHFQLKFLESIPKALQIMIDIKIEFIDNDQVVRAQTDVALSGEEDTVFQFLQQLKEELLPGETAFIEIEGLENDSITFEISLVENWESQQPPMRRVA